MKLLLIFITRVFLTLIACGAAIIAIMLFSENLSYFSTWVSILVSTLVAILVGWPQIKWWKKFLKEE